MNATFNSENENEFQFISNVIIEIRAASKQQITQLYWIT